MQSWEMHLQGYEFIEWNEDNFDVSAWLFAAEAYKEKKYAFVADVARLYALFSQGGVYLDTDVEILKPLDPFLVNRAFTGFEKGKDLTTGLMGAEAGSEWIREFMQLYDGRHFILPDGGLDMTTNVRRITDYMVHEYGLREDGSFQDFEGLVTVYPGDYFSPLNPFTRRLVCTPNTVAIHHYMASWEPRTPAYVFRRIITQTLGAKAYDRIRAYKLKLFPKAW